MCAIHIILIYAFIVTITDMYVLCIYIHNFPNFILIYVCVYIYIYACIYICYATLSSYHCNNFLYRNSL